MKYLISNIKVEVDPDNFLHLIYTVCTIHRTWNNKQNFFIKMAFYSVEINKYVKF